MTAPVGRRPRVRRDKAEVEITKGDCRDCPWYEDCPRMRGINRCYSDGVAASVAGQDGPPVCHDGSARKQGGD